MRRSLLALAALLLSFPAVAQTATVVSSCGAPAAVFAVGRLANITIDTNGNTCIYGSVAILGSTSNGTDGQATTVTNTPSVSYGYLFNGATWDRARGDTTSGAWVNVKTFPALVAGTAQIGYVGGSNVDVSSTPTVQNAAYSASNAIGGWQQLSVFRNTTQPSGIINYVGVASKGGSTTALTIYAFNKSSANLSSTCTDKSAFSLNAADLSALIPGFPVTLTPATTQGATITSASQSVVVSVKNADGTPSQNITLCAVVGGSVTPASTSDLVFNVALVQD